MHDAVQVVLRHVFSRIPKPILQEAFIPKEVDVPNTIDHYIDLFVISKVLQDCNLYAGKMKRILLTQDYLEPVQVPIPYSSLAAATIGVYRIPPEQREYRDISHVHSLTYPYSASGYTSVSYPSNAGEGITMASKAADVIGSHNYANVSITPRPILLAGDLVRFDPPTLAHIDYILVCTLKYDTNFTNLNPSAIMPLAELVLCATKIFIYNELVLQIDKARIIEGFEQGRFKEIVDSYYDETTRYEELLLSFRGAANLDPEYAMALIGASF